MLQATSEARLLSALESARNLYRQKMESVCVTDAAWLPHVDLREMHEHACREAMQLFKQKYVMIDQAIQSRGEQLQQVYFKLLRYN